MSVDELGAMKSLPIDKVSRDHGPTQSTWIKEDGWDVRPREGLPDGVKEPIARKFDDDQGYPQGYKNSYLEACHEQNHIVHL